jgi:anaerobic C4-dicarboxylate transporter DcuA
LLLIEFLIILTTIIWGLRLGSVGIGLLGCLALFILTNFFSIKTCDPPLGIILTILSVVTASAALQANKGLQFLTQIAVNLIKKDPKKLNYYAPLICYGFTLFCGTGHIIYSLLPLISKVSYRENIRSEYPLSLSVIASQLAVYGSPLSAATVVLAGILSPFGYGIFDIISISIPSTLFGVLLSSYLVPKISRTKNPGSLEDFTTKEYLQDDLSDFEKKSALTSILIFVSGIFLIILFSFFKSFFASKISHYKVLSSINIVPVVMFLVFSLIVLICKISLKDVIKQNIFSTGGQALIAILGLAWMGESFISTHKELLFAHSSFYFKSYPIIFALAIFVFSIFLFSQSITIQIVFPLGISLGISPSLLLIFYLCSSGFFIIPNYPTIVAAIGVDQTRTTVARGSYFLNHSFMLPGLIATLGSLSLAFGLKYLFLT